MDFWVKQVPIRTGPASRMIHILAWQQQQQAFIGMTITVHYSIAKATLIYIN